MIKDGASGLYEPGWFHDVPCLAVQGEAPAGCLFLFLAIISNYLTNGRQ
jgi:hypothetical protein